MKKILALALVLIMALSFVACNQGAGGGSDDAVTLKVWGPQEEQDLLKEMCEAFAAEYPDITFTFEYGVVSEADAKARYLEDPEMAADVFMFANDQVKDLVAAGALYEVAGDRKAAVVAANGEGSIGSATIDGKLYAFPMTADNGYFMYYDKSVLSEEDVQSLDGMMAAANAAGKKVFMDVSNGWYIASFFLGAGGTLGIDADGNQTCDFNDANGLAAAEAIKAFTADSAFITGDDSVLVGGMGDSVCAGVSGTWNANDIKAILGDNYGATKLPTFTMNGAQVQMSSFAGYKLVGVNRLTANAEYALALADWLTNEANQLRRFEARGLGPSNINVASTDAVLNAPELAALSEQGLYAVSQNDVLGNYWIPAEAFGAAMEAKDYSKSLQEQLDDMVAQIVA